MTPVSGIGATSLKSLYDLTSVVAFGVAAGQPAHLLDEGHGVGNDVMVLGYVVMRRTSHRGRVPRCPGSFLCAK